MQLLYVSGRHAHLSCILQAQNQSSPNIILYENMNRKIAWGKVKVRLAGHSKTSTTNN